MKALITGAAGFVGKHLVSYIRENENWDITATIIPGETFCDNDVSTYDLDISDHYQLEKILKNEKPDYIFHLAAQSSVAASWKKPAETIDINIKGTLNLLESVKANKLPAKILLIGSSEEYGRQPTPTISETRRLNPLNIYAMTKACCGMLANIYSEAYGMDIVTARAFNHIGPGQNPAFVVADFCKQVAEIEKAAILPVIKVGNLSSKRDFTDVRDIVRAYCVLIQKGQSGEIYNVGSGKSVEINEILKLIISMSTKDIAVETDLNKFRPSDTPEIKADIEKITADTGWTPQIPLEASIKDTLDWCRSLV